MLERGKGQLELAMAKHMSSDRLIRLALTAATHNPKLYECTQQSIGLALLTASQLGIEPNGRDGHLVPYKGVCQFLPDFKGLIKLAYRNPRVQSFHAAAVRENDLFEFEYGTDSFIRHTPSLSNRGNLICAYAICKLKDADPQFIVMGAEAIEKRRAKAQTLKIWDAWPDEMWTKTAVKSLSKLIPLGGEFEQAIEHDNKTEGGIGAIDVEFSEVPEEESNASGSDKLADKLTGNSKKKKTDIPKEKSEAESADDSAQVPPAETDAPTSEKSSAELFEADMLAATSLVILREIKGMALQEAQLGSIEISEWKALQSLYEKLKNSFTE